MNKTLLCFCLLLCFNTAFGQIQNSEKEKIAKELEASGRLSEAFKIYSELYSSDKSNESFFYALSRVSELGKDYDSALRLYKERVNSHPDDFRSFLRLGSCYYLTGHEKEAYAAWDDALKISPNSLSNFKAAATEALGSKATGKAMEILRIGSGKTKDPRLFDFDLAALSVLTAQYQEASCIYCRILRLNPDDFDQTMARIAPMLKDQKFLRVLLESSEKSCKSYPVFLRLSSKLLCSLGRSKEALKKIVLLDSLENAGGGELFSFAEGRYSSSDYETASLAYGTYLRDHPNAYLASDAMNGYAKSTEEFLNQNQRSNVPLFKLGPVQDSSGLGRYRELVNIYRKLTANFQNNDQYFSNILRLALLQKEKFAIGEEADSLMKFLIANAPRSEYASKALLSLASSSIEKGDLASAEVYCNRVLNSADFSETQKNSAIFEKARILFYRGEFSKAEKLLGPLSLKYRDDSANDGIRLSFLISAFGKDSLALSIYARGACLSRAGKLKEAEQCYRKLALNQGLIMLKDLAKFKLVQILIVENRAGEALPLLNEADTSRSMIAEDALLLSSELYYFSLNDTKRASDCLIRLLKDYPSSSYLERARRLLNRILKTKPETNERAKSQKSR